jgi:hypothetical protein
MNCPQSPFEKEGFFELVFKKEIFVPFILGAGEYVSPLLF